MPVTPFGVRMVIFANIPLTPLAWLSSTTQMATVHAFRKRPGKGVIPRGGAGHSRNLSSQPSSSITSVTTLKAEDAAVSEGQLSLSETKGLDDVIRKLFFTEYKPNPEDRPFLERIQAQKKGGVEVKVAVLGSRESRQFFGVSLASRGIQPVWVEIDNKQGDGPIFLDQVKMDPNYYPPLEAARVCHFANLKRLAQFGVFSWIVFLPLAVLLPLKLVTAGSANRKMDEYFSSRAFPQGVIEAGKAARGFVFASLDDGTKVVSVNLVSSKVSVQNFEFTVPVPGISLDYSGRKPTVENLYPNQVAKECNQEDLQTRLRNEPRAVTNRKDTREGDPVNLVIVGEFSTVLAAFGARWDETEPISLTTCWKTAQSFVLGSQYRYSPVSALYMYGRSQDFALQRARSSISERLHLRLWLTPALFEGKPVWVGQVSRDIGVRLAKTWNLSTHKIDPAVDEARNYVMTDLLQSGHLDRMTYVEGVGISEEAKPRCNLTGDPFVTDGKRAVIILSPTKTTPRLLEW